jgi:glycerol kinase
MKDLILSIDQGTTSTKVLVMDQKLNLLAEHATPFQQYFPQPGWVEHDANEIWGTVLQGLQVIGGLVDLNQVVAIGITNQRETLCFWNRATVEPVYRSIVWQDRRTSECCQDLKNQNLESMIQHKTGLIIDPYFSSSKLEWVLKNVPSIKKLSDQGLLAVGTIDSFLLAKLTNGKSHATEPSNASRTQLFDIESIGWSDDLLKVFGIPEQILPKVQPTFSNFGTTLGVAGLRDGIPITGMIGDQQSALLGQSCVEAGQAKCTYGTGAFLLMNTGSILRRSQHRLLTTIAWVENQTTTYALEGSAFMAGATIQWLRDGLQIIRNSSEIEALANEVATTDGVTFVPAFTGMGAPYWDPSARALISGLTRGSNRAHIARAALEGIAFQNVDLLKAMEQDLGSPLKFLNVDGGACKNNLLMQIQADLLGCQIRRPVFTESTALGAVFAAGLGAKIWTSISDIQKNWKLDRQFDPAITEVERQKRLVVWKNEVKRARQ